jgi:hypothetical protein
MDHSIAVNNGSKINKPHPVDKAGTIPIGHLQRQPRLPQPARTNERDDAMPSQLSVDLTQVGATCARLRPGRGEPDTAAVIAGYLDRHDRQHSSLIEDRRELSRTSQQSYTTDTARGAAMTRDEIIQFTLESLHTPD